MLNKYNDALQEIMKEYDDESVKQEADVIADSTQRKVRDILYPSKGIRLLIGLRHGLLPLC